MKKKSNKKIKSIKNTLKNKKPKPKASTSKPSPSLSFEETGGWDDVVGPVG